MSSIQQQVIRDLFRGDNYFSKNYNEIICGIIGYIELLSESDKEKLNHSEIEKNFLNYVQNHDVDLKSIYRYCSIANNDFKNTIDDMIVNHSYSSNVMIQYLLLNDKSGEDIINLIPRIMRNFNIKNLDLLEILKSKIFEENIFDESINKIKSSKDIRTIINASLYYDNRLIVDIFETKLDMYFYIKESLSFSEEEKELYIKKLSSIDDNELGIYIDKFRKRVQDSINKINSKILSKI